MIELDWISTPDPLHIEPSLVHVWRVVHPLENKIDSHQSMLSPEENRRATKYHQQHDADRYIQNHIVLRRTLSEYLDIPPENVVFETNQIGKPSLINSQNPQRINFNISHSGNLLLIAITLQRQVGIDVELIKPLPDMDSMVELYFSQSENSSFSALPDKEKIRAFFSAWTRKEAILKLIGEGLQLPPDGVEVSLNPEDPLPWSSVRENAYSQKNYQLFSFQPAEGYQAALAVEGDECAIMPIQYPG